MKVLLVILVFGILLMLETSVLIRNKRWREFIASGFLWMVGLVVSVLLVAGVKFPNVTTALVEFMKRVLHIGG